MYECTKCKETLFNTPYYKTEEGKVCEDCFECDKED